MPVPLMLFVAVMTLGLLSPVITALQLVGTVLSIVGTVTSAVTTSIRWFVRVVVAVVRAVAKMVRGAVGAVVSVVTMAVMTAFGSVVFTLKGIGKAGRAVTRGVGKLAGGTFPPTVAAAAAGESPCAHHDRDALVIERACIINEHSANEELEGVPICWGRQCTDMEFVQEIIRNEMPHPTTREPLSRHMQSRFSLMVAMVKREELAAAAFTPLAGGIEVMWLLVNRSLFKSINEHLKATKASEIEFHRAVRGAQQMAALLRGQPAPRQAALPNMMAVAARAVEDNAAAAAAAAAAARAAPTEDENQFIAFLHKVDAGQLEKEAAEDLIKTKKVSANTRDEEGYPVLHTVVLHGEMEILRLLHKHAVIVMNMRNPHGRTALMIAAGASDRPGHAAPPQDRTEFVKTLVHWGADVNAMDNDRWTALHFAAAVDNLPAVKILLRAGADTTKLNGAGKRAQQVAGDAVHSLLGMEIDANVKDEMGVPLLHHLVELVDGGSEVLEAVRLAHDADPVPRRGSRPRHIAEIRTRLNALTTVYGFTWATNEVNLFRSQMANLQALFQLLVDNGADVNATDAAGCTALMKAYPACYHRHMDGVDGNVLGGGTMQSKSLKLLLDLGADTQIKCSSSETWEAGFALTKLQRCILWRMEARDDGSLMQDMLEAIKELLVYEPDGPLLLETRVWGQEATPISLQAIFEDRFGNAGLRVLESVLIMRQEGGRGGPGDNDQHQAIVAQLRDVQRRLSAAAADGRKRSRQEPAAAAAAAHLPSMMGIAKAAAAAAAPKRQRPAGVSAAAARPAGAPDGRQMDDAWWAAWYQRLDEEMLAISSDSGDDY